MSDILNEVRVRGYGQDRDIKVTIEKVGLFNKKRKVYSTFWGSNKTRFEEDKPLYEWDPIEFTLKDLTEDNNFGEYQKYYEAYIKERDQPKTGFRAYNNFQRNNLEFSNEWNTDLDIIKLYILINTEKYKEKIYEWALIENPIKGEKGGLAPYYRSFGYDGYYLNNGTKVRINWTDGKYTAGGESWSDSKGKELSNQDLSRYNTSYLEKKTKSYFEKTVDGMWAPDKNPAGDGFLDFDPKGVAPNFVKESIYGEGRQKWSALTDDISILNQIVSAWKQAVPGYDNLAVLKNDHGTPAIEISDSKEKLIDYKSPFGMSASGPSASGPSASDAGTGASASGASASKANTFTPTFQGIQDGFQITAKTDIPSFSIYVGDPEKWPVPEDTKEEIAAGRADDFENVGDEGLDEEFTEAEFVETNLNSVDDEPIGMIYSDAGDSGGDSGGDSASGPMVEGGSATDKSAIGKGPNPGSKLLYKSGGNYFLFNSGNGLAGHRLKNVLTDLTKYLNANGFAGAKLGNNGIMRDLVASTYPNSPARAVASLHGAGLAIDVTFNIPGKKWKGIGDNGNLAADANLTQVIAKWVAGQGDLTWGAQWGGSSPSTGVVKGRGITEYHHFEIKSSLIVNYWKPFESELSKMGFAIAKLNTTGKGGEIFKLNKVLLNSVGIA